MKATKSKLPNTVDEIEGECEIAQMWQHQFTLGDIVNVLIRKQC